MAPIRPHKSSHSTLSRAFLPVLIGLRAATQERGSGARIEKGALCTTLLLNRSSNHGPHPQKTKTKTHIHTYIYIYTMFYIYICVNERIQKQRGYSLSVPSFGSSGFLWLNRKLPFRAPKNQGINMGCFRNSGYLILGSKPSERGGTLLGVYSLNPKP